MAFANGYTMVMRFNLDSLGWIYISLATFWTLILSIGIAFLISKRDLPYLRIRNVPLAVSAVATLHVYWVLCMIAYVLQGFFPCSTEYWIMSIYLPLGIALFQACNTQLLYIADLQQKYVTDIDPEEKSIDKCGIQGWRRYLAYLYVRNRVKRTMVMIGYGMGVQVTVAMLVFLISRKFHPNFGLVGEPTFSRNVADDGSVCRDLVQQYKVDVFLPTDSHQCDAAKKMACRRGWEWIPSIIWQFFWSWCYAPYLLWQVRNINDVHGWRKQTSFCCLAGLFATPMWLCALYIPDMLVVNHYYVPPLWFVPPIFLIEAFLIFVPCWQVFKNHRLQSETLNIIAEWESKNNGNSISDDTMERNSRISKKPSAKSTTSSRRGDLYTMTALESAIRTNPQPLLLFASLKDFSGENISFLTQVLEWKRGWSPSSSTRSGFLRRPSVYEINNKALQRQQFKRAVDIYASYVSLKYSDYAINLSHAHLKELEAVFENAASVLYSHKMKDSGFHNATPFENVNFTRSWPSSHTPISPHEDIEASPGKHDGVSIVSHKTHTTNGTNQSTDPILQNPEHDAAKRQSFLQAYEMTDATVDTLPDSVLVPGNFGPDVFDHAEESIKYMVLTNTWPKFVNEGYASTGVKPRTFLQQMQGRFLQRSLT